MAEKTRSASDSVPPAVYAIFVALIIDLFAFTVILPLFPSLFEYYSEHDESGLYAWFVSQVSGFQRLLNVPSHLNNVLLAGFIGLIYSFLQFLTAPVMGALSDVYGRKPVLLANNVGLVLSYVIWAFSGSFDLFLLSRIIGGMSKVNVSLYMAVVTDVCSPQTRNKGMALLGVAFSVGFVVGPMLGAYFATEMKSSSSKDGFYVAPAIFAVVMALLEMIFVYAFIPETLAPEKRALSVASSMSGVLAYINPSSLFSFSAVQKLPLKDHSTLRHCGMAYFLFLFFYSGLEYSLSFLAHTRFGYTRMQQGKMYVVIGVIMATIQGGFSRRVRQGSELKVVFASIALVVPAFVVIGLCNSTSMLLVGIILYALGTASVVPVMTTFVSQFGHTSQKGTIIGIFRSLGALARALGPFASAIVYWSAGPAVCYCVGAAAFIFPLGILWRLMKSQKLHFPKPSSSSMNNHLKAS